MDAGEYRLFRNFKIKTIEPCKKYMCSCTRELAYQRAKLLPIFKYILEMIAASYLKNVKSKRKRKVIIKRQYIIFCNVLSFL